MKKSVYTLSIFIGIGIWIYFYLFNFDNMSETELVQSVLYWYVPLVFGLYGITALEINKTITDPDQNTIRHLFSGANTSITVLTIILLAIGGIIGIVLFFLPLLLFRPKSHNFDLNVALMGLVLWTLLLYLFFEVLWPAL